MQHTDEEILCPAPVQPEEEAEAPAEARSIPPAIEELFSSTSN